MEEQWMDENGNYLEVVPKTRVFEPFDPKEDTWCDLSFLRTLRIFRDMVVPSYGENPDDSGLGNEWMENVKFKNEEYARLREERIERKEFERLNPHLKRRQKKKGRTARRRRPARDRRLDRKFEAIYGKLELNGHQGLQPDAGWDERVMNLPMPNSWRVIYWLISFLDDNFDHKLHMNDKSKQVFWPAEPIPKRMLGYELLTFMTPGDAKRSASLSSLERERTSEVEKTRDDALRIGRSKSESDLTEESEHWLLMKEKEREVFEDNIDIYIALVEDERQDEIDEIGVNFYYTF